ncbi:MFS general substrate transporter [Glarea lozoyensis ATCC 20868]|uniref:MFS general substrate transporter n=1 Tax=Glarea lozoyensis (strain ATCC 20868 / MF5171) TaxID=1116229 RepID=S3D064_GLAL2|nr:MFS general substrate transporter [Glarea lozoyensis ATCC 20868]EPE31907.1 MFS general substrate transporter [Glarea lozoyensis ATCC 20868]
MTHQEVISSLPAPDDQDVVERHRSSPALSIQKVSILEHHDQMESSDTEGIQELVPDHGSNQPLPTWRLFTIIGCLCVGLFLTLMDMSIISTALYTISLEFQNYDHTIWAALSYILADIGCGVCFTRLADVYGRKNMVLSAFFFFTCFSLGCGFAQSVEQLIIFRTLQGIGGAGLYSLTMVICPEISPPRLLHYVVGSLGATVAVAGVCGPVLGGVITGGTTWRWIFWLNVPIGVITMIVLFLPGQRAQTSHKQWIVLLSGSLTTLELFSWLSEAPMVMAIITTLMAGFVQFAVIFSIPLRAQLVDLKSATQAGIRLLPLVSATAVGSLIGGGSSAKQNLTFFTMTFAMALVAIGSGLLSTLPEGGAETKAIYGYQVTLGIGLGMSISTATFMTSMEVEFVDHAVAQGLVAQARILGGAFGLVASTIIMNNHIETFLKGHVTDEVLRKILISPFSILDYGVEAALLFRSSYIHAFSQDMRVSMYIAIVGFVSSLCIYQKNPPTVAERSELLAKAVQEYKDEVRTRGRATSENA